MEVEDHIHILNMTTLRQFTCNDMFRFNPINLDPLTETYGVGFYLQYMARWPEYFVVAEAPDGGLMGYIMGKAEGDIRVWIRTFSITPLALLFSL